MLEIVTNFKWISSISMILTNFLLSLFWMACIIKLSNLRILSLFFVTVHELDLSLIVFSSFHNLFLSSFQDSKEKSSGIMNSSVSVKRTFYLLSLSPKRFQMLNFLVLFFCFYRLLVLNTLERTERSLSCWFMFFLNI